MSVFGKKALSHWNWEMPESSLGNEMKRWNSTPKEFQLDLLKKRYPIGMRGKCILVGSNKPSKIDVVINGYLEYLWGYQLDVNYTETLYRKESHPIRFVPEIEDRNQILRELRLNKLLDQSI